jgi:stage III sporulation protein AG
MGEVWSRLNEKQKKLFSWLAVVLVIGVGFFLIQPSTPTQVPTTVTGGFSVEPKDSDPYREHLQKELQSILSSMVGGKSTEVFLTMERGASLKVAYDLTEEERIGSEGLQEKRRTSSPVLMRNDAERKEVPLILEETEPVVRGVLVVVDQEPYPELRLQVAQAVATALQIPMYRIEVLFKQ